MTTLAQQAQFGTEPSKLATLYLFMTSAQSNIRVKGAPSWDYKKGAFLVIAVICLGKMGRSATDKSYYEHTSQYKKKTFCHKNVDFYKQ